MRSQGFPDHTRWRHLTFGGPSDGALKLFFLQRSRRSKRVFIGFLAVGCVRRNRSLPACFRRHVGILWQIRAGCEDARAFFVQQFGAIQQKKKKHNGGSRLPERIWQ